MENSIWIKQLAKKEQYIAEKILVPGSVWPTPIVKAYDDLIALMKDGNVYGALLQVRGLYETILRMPVLAALIYICGIKKEIILADADLLEKWVGKTLSLGDWEALSAGLINKKNIEKYSLPEILINLISNTRKLINKKISSDYPNISNWRNEVIGHGALQFEDSMDYQNAFPGLLSNLKDYFEGNGKDFNGCDQFYEKIFFQYNEINLQGPYGDNLNTGGNFRLKVDELTVDVGAFAQMKSFFFSSFYCKKGTVKYLDYNSGRDLIKRDTELNDYISAFRNADKHQEKKYASKIVRRDEEQYLRMLSQPQGYIPPKYVFNQIKQFMDEREKGIIFLLMERGMGKTAFSNSLDSLYHDPDVALIEDTVIRAYPLGNAELRGINDFINAINIIFTRAFDATHDFRFSGELKPEIDVDEDYPAETLANVLNAYQEIYSQEFGIYNLMLILDGIDEVTVNTGRILEYLPTSELLNEGVYIICTSRPENETTVAGTAKKYIRKVTEKSDLCIELNRDSEENRCLLEKYVRQEMPDIDQKTLSDLIERSEKRVLYLKVQTALYKSNIQGHEELFSNDRIVVNYVHLMLNKLNGQSKALFRKVAAMICLLSPITIKDYFEYISGDELTYGFIGSLNDLLPILTTRGSDYGREYMFANEKYLKSLSEELHDEIIALMDNIKISFFTEFFSDESQINVSKEPRELSIEQVNDMDRYRKYEIFWVFTIQKITHFASQYGFENNLFSQKFVEYALSFLDMFIVNNRMDVGYVQTVTEEARKTALSILMTVAVKKINISFPDVLAYGSFPRELYNADGYEDLIGIVFNRNVKEETLSQWKDIFFSWDLNVNGLPTDYYIEDKILLEQIKQNKLLKSVVSFFTPNGSITYLSYLLHIAALDIEKGTEELVFNMIVWSYLSDDIFLNIEEAKKWLAKIKESGLNILYPENDCIKNRVKNCLGTNEIDIVQRTKALFNGFRTIEGDLSDVNLKAIENALTSEDNLEKEAALYALDEYFDEVDNIFNKGILPQKIWSEERREEYYRQCYEGSLGEEEISRDEYVEQFQYTIINNCRFLLKYLHLTYGNLTGVVLEQWIESLDDCLKKHDDEECFFKLEETTYALYCTIVNYYADDIPKKLSYLSRYVERYDIRWYQNPLYYRYNGKLSVNIILPTVQSISLMVCYQEAGKYQEARQLCTKIAAGNAELEKNVLDRLSQPDQWNRDILNYDLNLYDYVCKSHQMGFSSIVDGIQYDFKRELKVLEYSVKKRNRYSLLFDIQTTVDSIIWFFEKNEIKDTTRKAVFSKMAKIISDKMTSADEETIKALSPILEEINNANNIKE